MVAGGDFSTAGGRAAYRVARWDGSAWHPMGTLNSSGGASVQAFAVYQGELIVAGRFAVPGTTGAYSIARWSNGSWLPVGPSLDGDPDGDITAMTMQGDDLFVIGSLRRIGQQTVNGFARWNGVQWSAIPGRGFQARAISWFEGDFIAQGPSFGGTIRNWARWSPALSPVVTSDPQGASTCRDSAVSFTAVADGVPTPTYQWRRNSNPLTNGRDPSGSSPIGVNTPTLSIFRVSEADVGTYDCVITNACGAVTTAGAALTVCSSDFDCDGASNSQDFFDFLSTFFNGDPRADFDRDGAVTGLDLFAYLAFFFDGCA